MAQETWLAALEHPPAPGASPRSWLGQVARNAARQVGRAEARRARREREAAREEALPSAEELAAVAARQREVVGHVLALEEPYRSTVLLRFFEHLPPR